MAAGLGFKDFQTGEVLTAADVDGYLMQGIWVFASTAARDAAVTSPSEGNFAFTKDTNSLWYYDGAAWVASGATGDIEGVTAGIGISGGGTSGTVTVTNSMATAIDAKGDLVVGTGADTFSKLTVGANDTVLVADSTEATGLKWATPSSGGMTLISTTTLTGSSVTLSSIPQTYNDLRLIIRNFRPVGNSGLFMRINGNSSANYKGTLGNQSNQTFSDTYMEIFPNQQNSAASQFICKADIPDYTNSTTWKVQYSYGAANGNVTSTSATGQLSTSAFNQTGAITSLTFLCDGVDFTSGTVLLYGVK